MNNVVLVGFMGSGKSTVGPKLAEELGRTFMDLDQEIEGDAGRPISEIFTTEGEAGFRAREAAALRRALSHSGAVISVGGGAPLDEDNWREIRSGNCVIGLITEPAELVRRLDGPSGRPLLQPDTRSAIATLLPIRLTRYLESDVLLMTDGLSPEEVASEIRARLPVGPLHRIPVEVPGASHELVIGHRLEALVASTLRRLQASKPVAVISDVRLGQTHAGRLVRELGQAGFLPALHLVPVGEAAKELDVLAGLFEVLARARVDRQGALIALGGGSIGDVTGFSAATWMRGIRYIQVPTTLLAMVDSSIGGKTAINLPAGKNLAGLVHQPSAIFCDLDYLRTLPQEEFVSALAEVIKVGLVADRSFVEWLRRKLPSLVARDLDTLLEAIRAAASIKAGLVSADPYDRAERAILNYGHTVGHALERAIGFGQIRHGQAVAWGMEVAARISVLSGSCLPRVAEVQHELLGSAGLLQEPPRVGRHVLMEAIGHDKKSFEGRPRWVLLRELGKAAYGRSVDEASLEAALAEVLR